MQNPAPARPVEITNFVDVMHVLVVTFHIHPPPSRCATACCPGVIMRTMTSPDDGLRALHLLAAPVDVLVCDVVGVVWRGPTRLL